MKWTLATLFLQVLDGMYGGHSSWFVFDHVVKLFAEDLFLQNPFGLTSLLLPQFCDIINKTRRIYQLTLTPSISKKIAVKFQFRGGKVASKIEGVLFS